MKPISFPWQQGGGQNGGIHEDHTMPLTKNQTLAVAFSCKDHGADAGDVSPTLRSMTHSESHANGGGQVAVAIDAYNGAIDGDVAATFGRNSGGTNNAGQKLLQAMQVRRLSVRECERLQGFPDGWTNVPYRGKPAADGPRYKALGNSMACNVMQWLGERIKMVEENMEQLCNSEGDRR